MKRAELEKIFVDIQTRLTNLEAQLPTGMKLEDAVTKISTTLQESQDNLVTTTSVLTAIQQNKTESETAKNAALIAKEEIEKQKEALLSDKKQFEEFSEAFKQMQEGTKSLQLETKNLLGIVNAEKLANSFEAEAKKLEKSIDGWFWWLFGSVLFFLLALASVTIWQLTHSNSLLEFNYFLKVILTAPIAYFLVFVARQYSRDIGLYNEYTFKASVARSFEAYRQLLEEQKFSEEVDATLEAKLLDKKFDFLTATITQIYSSPIHNGMIEEMRQNKMNISALDHLASWVEKIGGVFKK